MNRVKLYNIRYDVLTVHDLLRSIFQMTIDSQNSSRSSTNKKQLSLSNENNSSTMIINRHLALTVLLAIMVVGKRTGCKYDTVKDLQLMCRV